MSVWDFLSFSVELYGNQFGSVLYLFYMGGERVKPKAYEGNKPYIFISYAHKDTELVFRVMNSLQEEGYRIWYDDGIMPGSEWPENIAQHLDAAAMVISMVTPNSMDSHNCRREINFALSRRKPFLALILEPTKMSLGMEMQLSAQHNIYLQNYSNWDDFIDKILICEDLQPCKEEVIAPVTEAPAVETVEEKPVVAEVPAVVSAEPVEVAPKKPAKPKKEKSPKAKKEKAPKPKRPIGKILLGAVVCIALVAALGIGIKKANTYTMSWGSAYEKNASSVYATDEVVLQSDLETLMAFPKLKHVNFNGCDFSGCDFTGLRFRSEVLETVDFTDCTGINDFGFLENQPLSTIYISGSKNFTDLSVLDQSRLDSLDISGTGVSDLSPLTAKLYRIKFDNTAISDVSPLTYLSDIWEISGRNTAVTNIDALAELESLEELDFSGCAIKQVSATFKSLRLSQIRFADCGITDLSGFTDVTRLFELDVSGNPELEDMSWLNVQNREKLRYLYLNHTGLDADDIAFVAACPQLQKLNISGISVGDLNLCKRLPELKVLYAVKCGLKDIGGLKDCAKMETLGLGYNEIMAVDVLKGMEALREADLSFNKVKSVAPLGDKKIRTLWVHGNDPALAATIPEGLTGYNLSVDWHAGVCESGLKNRGAYTAVYLVDCPADQILKTQDVLGKGYCNFTDTTQLVDLIARGELRYKNTLDYSYTSDLYRSGT